MSSIIQGYEYDIFISYRQKDNKGDRWVSEFVDNLKEELESTFKEEISVYFDINPHDGLLETHDVDASLKEKLRCLIFIPIISRTYCDPRSFAWEHEFKVFIELASSDQFGLKIKLTNGNVASRVLPVRIYDLDAADIKFCESVLGGVIRGIDFVYKEVGVNRPLTPEDDENTNLNYTRYRNQINKTANAIREIISGLKSEPEQIPKNKPPYRKSHQEIKSYDRRNELLAVKMFSNRTIRRLVIIFLLTFCAIGAFAIYKIINMAKPAKTIAVYFAAEANSDTALKDIAIIYTEAIYNKLFVVRDLTLRPRIDMLHYMNTEKSLSAIRKDLAANYLLYGNIRRSGDDIIIWVELTSEKAKKDLWLKKFIWNKNLISKNTSEIVEEIADNLKAKLSPDDIMKIKSEPTKNAEANLNYTYANAISYNTWSSFTMGNKYLESISFNSAIQAYDKAIKEDSLFAQAYAKRAIARSWGYYTRQLDSTHFGKCLEDIKRAGEIDSNLPDIQIALGFYYYYCKKDLDKALNFFSIASEKNPEDFEPLFYVAMVYRRKGEWNKSQNLIRQIVALDPQDALCLTNIGLTYNYFHNYDSALMFHQKAIDVMPVWPSPYKNKIETLILKNSDTTEARSLLNTAVQNTGGSFTELNILLDIYERKYYVALKKAEKSYPSDFKFKGNKYLYLANINSLLKNPLKAQIYYDSALVSFNREIDKDKNNPEIHSYLAIACAGKKNKEEAIKEGKKAVDLIKYNNFDKSDMILNLARIYTMTGEYDQALITIDYLLQTRLNIPSCFSVNLLQLDPVWKPLSDKPEYHALLRQYFKN